MECCSKRHKHSTMQSTAEDLSLKEKGPEETKHNIVSPGPSPKNNLDYTLVFQNNLLYNNPFILLLPFRIEIAA